MNKKCPRWMDKETRVEVVMPDDDGNVTTKTVVHYESLTCDENCALYEFRPKCVLWGGGI